VGPRSLNVQPTYRRRRVWPWVAAAAILLAVGLWEVHARRGSSAGASRSPGGSGGPAETTVGTAPAPGSSTGQGTMEAAARGPAGPATRGVGGRVLRPDGRPAEGVDVVVLPDGLDARTDALGRFAAPVADGASVQVQAHHSDLGFASAELQAPAVGVELRLSPRATVVVKVLAGGRPVPGAAVVVEDLGHPGATFQADRRTDLSGVLRFAGLPAGALRVEASAEGSRTRASAPVEAVEGSVAQVTLTLPASETRTP